MKEPKSQKVMLALSASEMVRVKYLAGETPVARWIRNRLMEEVERRERGVTPPDTSAK